MEKFQITLSKDNLIEEGIHREVVMSEEGKSAEVTVFDESFKKVVEEDYAAIKKLENYKIAVFARTDQFRQLIFRTIPTNVFRHIASIDDIRGIRFIGVIEFPGNYWDNRRMSEAYQALRMRQPELFH